MDQTKVPNQAGPGSSEEKPVEVQLFEAFRMKAAIRDDGVYLTVTKQNRDASEFSKIRQALHQALVMNADLDCIKDVIGRARGVPEKIGPRFEFYNPVKDSYIIVDYSSMEAKLTLNADFVTDGVLVTEKDILYRLKMLEIVFGVNHAAIKDMLANKVYDMPVVVAKGLLAQDGVDAHIEEVVGVDADAKPVEKMDGSVDFKNIEMFKQISEGDVIANKYPATKGKDGTDIHGRPVRANPGEDAPLPGGENTRIINNGTTLVAACGGYLYRKDNLIHVGEVLTIPKDVDFSSGNIKYRGSLVVKGDVKPGFRVEAEDDVVIHGIVETADVVSRKGKVEVRNGVFGHGKATIYAGKDIHLPFAQNAKLEAEGSIVATKYLLHCECQALEVDVSDTGSNIVGGEVKAAKRIKVYDAGSDKGVRTVLQIVNLEQESFASKIKELEEIGKKVEDKLVPLQKRLKTMNSMIRQAKSVTDRSKMELKKVMDEYLALSKKMEYIKAKREEYVKKNQKPVVADGEICVAGTIHSLVSLEMYHRYRKEVKIKETQKRFYIKDEEIQMVSYTAS